MSPTRAMWIVTAVLAQGQMAESNLPAGWVWRRRAQGYQGQEGVEYIMKTRRSSPGSSPCCVNIIAEPDLKSQNRKFEYFIHFKEKLKPHEDPFTYKA